MKKTTYIQICEIEAQICKVMEDWEQSKDLVNSEPDIVDFLDQKFTLYPPELDRNNMYMENEGEARIDLSG